MTTLMTRSLATMVLAAALVGCSSTKYGQCDACNQGAVYPPPGCYDTGSPLTTPPAMPAPAPIPVPAATDPAMPPAPPPPLSARMSASLQNIRYSTGEFFQNANHNVRAMFSR